MLESIALGNFDRKTLKADVDINEFDQGLSDVLQGHLKSNISLLTLVEYILERINEGISSEDFKLNLGLHSIPQILLTIVDYVTEYFKLSDDRSKLEKMIFRTMHKICEESSSVLSQILKGSANRHFVRILRTNSIASLIFIQNLCQSEPNISIYLSRGLFNDLKKTYSSLRKTIASDFT